MLQRRNSWQDGVYGTNCPIPPGQNFTYALQVKNQIGSYFYFPSLALHKAAGGYGGLSVASRPMIPVPFDPPSGDFTILAGDWYQKSHTVKMLLWMRNMLHRRTINLINIDMDNRHDIHTNTLSHIIIQKNESN